MTNPSAIVGGQPAAQSKKSSASVSLDFTALVRLELDVLLLEQNCTSHGNSESAASSALQLTIASQVEIGPIRTSINMAGPRTAVDDLLLKMNLALVRLLQPWLIIIPAS